MNRQHAVGDALRTGLLDGGLRSRFLGRAESIAGPSWLVLLIEKGRARLSDEDDPIVGPALAWRPWSAETRAIFAPGATGIYVLIGPSALASAIGHLPEARELRELVHLEVTRSLGAGSATRDTLHAEFRGLHRELGSDASAARAIVDAYLRIILIEVYRARQSQSTGFETSPTSRTAFTRFSNLVEMHFRERWTVQAYAERLGMSRDRLGDVCTRVRGLGPKDIIDRRVMLEARLQLESSSLSIQQIAALLGFSSPPQFTRFFQRTAGVSPGRYRRQSEAQHMTSGMQSADHYEWP